MKKSIILLLAALMTLTAAAACAKTVAPMPARVNPDAVANQAVYVQLQDVDWRAETVTVALCEPETFAREETLALCPGDILLASGREIPVGSITVDLPVVRVHTDDDVCVLWENVGGDFGIMLNGRTVWTVVGERTFELSDDLILLDGIDPSTGEALTLPTAKTLQSLKDILMRAEYDPGFAADNAYMVFDDEQEAVVLARFYVPWQ